MVTAMIGAFTLYVVLFLFFRLLNWADTAPPEVQELPGLCNCPVDPMAGVYGHCSHKRARILEYVPRHAAA
jgi:hypothetical protein